MTSEAEMRSPRWWRLLRALKAPRSMYALQKMRWTTDAEGYSLRQFERTRSIFVHVPKACGVSIAKSLYGNLACGHRIMREYEAAFNPAFLSNCYVFTFVRNPWDRLFSAYRFLSKGGMNAVDQAWAQQHSRHLGSFETFVEEGLRNPALARTVHLKPQSRFLISGSGAFPITFVGFYENLPDDFGEVSRRILGQSSTLSHDNKTKGEEADYRTAYTDRMKAIVADFYADDITRFGYDFEGLNIAQQIDRRNAGQLLR